MLGNVLAVKGVQYDQVVGQTPQGRAFAVHPSVLNDGAIVFVFLITKVLLGHPDHSLINLYRIDASLREQVTQRHG